MNTSTTSGISFKDIISNYNRVITGFNSRLFIHPEALAAMKLPVEQKTSLLEGIPVNISNTVPKHPKKWEFSKCRFVEYEEKDEEWARPLRHGREVDDTDNYVAFKLEDYSTIVKMELDRQIGKQLIKEYEEALKFRKREEFGIKVFDNRSLILTSF